MIVLFFLFFGLLFAGVPIAFSLMAAGFVEIALSSRLSMMVGPQQLVDSIDSFPLLAVPFFIMAGTLMNEAGITAHLVRLARALIGHIRGGMAHTTALAGAMMAGGSGSGTADAAALGVVMIPSMKKEGYPAPFAAAVTACAGSLAPIIPPSIMFIIYGHLGNVSVGRLFLAGIVPGIAFCLCIVGVSYLVARRGGYGETTDRATVAEMARALVGSLLDLLLPIIIMGGIVGGVFTPTEAGAVAVLYILVIGTCVYRTLTWQKIYRSLTNTVGILGAVMLIMAAAGLAQFLLALTQAGELVAGTLIGISDQPPVFFLIVGVVLLLLGMVLEVTAVLILLTPILAPALAQYGIDPVHFGAFMVVSLTVGLLTPPVGLSMFVSCAIGGVRVGEYTRAILPFLAALIGLLVLMSLVPQLVLWLPQALG